MNLNNYYLLCWFWRPLREDHENNDGDDDDDYEDMNKKRLPYVTRDVSC
jgi:hypothetical protein